MNAAQRIDELAKLGRQLVIGQHHVGELRVAAVGRDHVAAQNRQFRWVDRGGDVGVPTAPRREQVAALVALVAAVALKRIDFRVVIVLMAVDRMRRRKRYTARMKPCGQGWECGYLEVDNQVVIRQ